MEIKNEQFDQIVIKIKDIYTFVAGARGLVYEGKEVLCYNKLQGALTKINDLLMSLSEFQGDSNDNVATQSS